MGYTQMIGTGFAEAGDVFETGDIVEHGGQAYMKVMDTTGAIFYIPVEELEEELGIRIG